MPHTQKAHSQCFSAAWITLFALFPFNYILDSNLCISTFIHSENISAPYSRQILSFRSCPHCWQLAYFKTNPLTFNKIVQRTVSQCCQSKISCFKTICQTEISFSYHSHLWLRYGELAESHQGQIINSSLWFTSCYHTESS